MPAQNDSNLPTAPLNILVVDDELNVRRTLSIALEADDHSVVAVGNRADAITEVASRSFDLALVDLRLGSDSGAQLLSELAASSPWTSVVIITAHGSIDAAVDAMKRGAIDFLVKPFTPAQVRLVTGRVQRLKSLERRVVELQSMVGSEQRGALLDSKHPAMQRAVQMARQVAATDASVLIRGESGTGKGLLARAIHGWSHRADKPFSTISCPSLSTQLLESELFGHVRGAFTGAIRDNPGRLAASEGGTVFLDEIGDLPTELQPKLLRFLQDRQYERVGDTRTRHGDVRILTATNVDLEDAVREKRFRQDLFYRINVVQIDLPPLRERANDIEPLAEQMLAELSQGRRAGALAPATVEVLKRYCWPGNVRELHNVLERATILATGHEILPEHLPPNLAAAPPKPTAPGDLVSLDALEEQHIRRVLAATRSLDEAAGILKIDVATLFRKRKRYGI
jgi:NtrC-family two-component system response regulator AlgB